MGYETLKVKIPTTRGLVHTLIWGAGNGRRVMTTVDQQTPAGKKRRGEVPGTAKNPDEHFHGLNPDGTVMDRNDSDEMKEGTPQPWVPAPGKTQGGRKR